MEGLGLAGVERMTFGFIALRRLRKPKQVLR